MSRYSAWRTWESCSCCAVVTWPNCWTSAGISDSAGRFGRTGRLTRALSGLFEARISVFDTLQDRLAATFKSLRGKGRLSDADIDATAREIRVALLEADVNLSVVKDFVAAIKERARAEELSRALNPTQQIIKIVNEELIRILGGSAP